MFRKESVVAYQIILKTTKLDMNKKLYVGGIPYQTTEDALNSYFSAAGTVTSVMIAKDKMTGRSRGFGFVEMGSEEEANKAIEMFHDKDFEGRKLTVNIARPLEDRPPRRDFDRPRERRSF